MRNLTWLLLLIALGVQAQVYKWKDETGKVHYSDQPPPAAKGKVQPLNLKETQVTTMPAAAKPVANASAPIQAASAPVAKPPKDERACAEAEKRLAFLKSTNLYKNVSNDKGQVEFLETKQKQKEIEEKTAFLEKNCK